MEILGRHLSICTDIVEQIRFEIGVARDRPAEVSPPDCLPTLIAPKDWCTFGASGGSVPRESTLEDFNSRRSRSAPRKIQPFPLLSFECERGQQVAVEAMRDQ